jgi:hypothetical protein
MYLVSMVILILYYNLINSLSKAIIIQIIYKCTWLVPYSVMSTCICIYGK